MIDFLLTPEEVDALHEAYQAKAMAAVDAGDVAAFDLWSEARRMLHQARLASFDKRAAEVRAKRRKKLGLPPQTATH